MAFENRLPPFVVRLEMFMNATINFNRQIVFKTIEVQNEASEHELSPELKTKQPAIAKQVPRESFGKRLVLA